MIKKIDGKYFVYSEDGKKLGGPYDTRKAAVDRLKQVEHFKHQGESIAWNLNSFKIEESGKWLKITGVALTTGKSNNDRNYNYDNLESNDGKMFNIIAGHREDYDNPDHIIGEGTYHFNGETLEYEAKVKNTNFHPDIIEQVQDGLLAPSIQGSFDAVVIVNESGEEEVNVNNLNIPLMALVTKHARGVSGANIETAIAERLELNNVRKVNEDKIIESKEAIKMVDEDFSKKLEESKAELNKVLGEKNKLEESNKEFKEKLEQLEKQEKDNALKEKVIVAESIVKLNSDFEKDELLKKSISELKTIKEYEDKLVKKSASEVIETDESIKDPLKGIIVEEKTQFITMTEEKREQLNKDLMNSIYR